MVVTYYPDFSFQYAKALAPSSVRLFVTRDRQPARPVSPRNPPSARGLATLSAHLKSTSRLNKPSFMEGHFSWGRPHSLDSLPLSPGMTNVFSTTKQNEEECLGR